MNNMNNCSDQTREKLKAAYMSRDLGVDFTREKFDRIIAAAEQERIRTLRRRKMIKVALVSLILCAACSGLLMGLITWEDASADNDDETKIIKQGDNLVIGNGVVDGDDMVGVTVEEYENIEDLPEEIREKAHFITVEGLTLNKIKMSTRKKVWSIETFYRGKLVCDSKSTEEIIIRETAAGNEKNHIETNLTGESRSYNGYEVYKQLHMKSITYYLILDENYINISIPRESGIKIETILDGLKSNG